MLGYVPNAAIPHDKLVEGDIKSDEKRSKRSRPSVNNQLVMLTPK